MSKREQIAALEQNKHLRTPAEVAEFDEALQRLSREGGVTAADLPNLFMVFDDDTQNEEVMFGLLHFVEDFDLPDMLRAFITVAPALTLKAPEWVKVFHYRILNSDRARALFKELLDGSDAEARRTVTRVLENIAATERPPLSTRAEFVLGADTGDA